MKESRKTNRIIYSICAIILSVMMTFTMIPPTFATDGGNGGTDPTNTPAATQGDENGQKTGQDGENGSAGDEEKENGGEQNSSDPAVDPTQNTENTEGAEEGDNAEEEQVTDNKMRTMKKADMTAKAEDEKPEPYGTPRDFTSMISGVDVQRMGSTQTSWSEVNDDNPVKTGDDVKFTLTYNVPMRYLSDHETNTLTYKVTPPIGSIAKEEGWVENDQGRKLGYYTIEPQNEGGEATGLVTIVFTDEAVRSNRTSRLDKGHVSFTSSVDGWNGTEDGVVDVPIGGDVGNVEVIIQPQDAVGDIKIVKKTTNTVNKATGELIQHQMVITSTSGTKTNVTVTDTMVLEVIKGNGNFKVTKTTPAKVDPDTGEETSPASTTDVTPLSLKNEKGQPAFNDSDGNHDSGFEMVLPPLGAGESYTITYDAYYPKMVNGSVYVKNTAIAKSTDEKDKLLISSSTTGNSLSNEPLAKTGELVVEGEGSNKQYFIEWTVIINPNNVDISGWTLKDTGLYNDGTTHLTAQDIKLIKDAKKQTDGSYTGTEITISNMTLNGEQTMYTFPENDSSNYVLQYRTPMNFDDTNYEAKNLIKMDPPPGDQDNEDNGSESETPGVKGIDTEKDHDDIEVDLSDPENPVAKIKWTMTIDATAAPVPADSVFEDVLGAKQEFEDSQDELKNKITQAFTAEGLTIEWVDQEEGKEKTQFKFKVTSGIPVGKKITFTYKSIVEDFKPNEQGTYTNAAKLLNPGNETIGNPTDSVVYKPMIEKYDSSNGKTTGTNRTTTHKVGDSYVTYNGNQQTIKWGFDVNMPGSYYGEDSTLKDYVIIRDELPEGPVPKYLAFGSDSFEGIETATKSNPSTVEKNLEDWIASEKDVENGYAKKAGDKISDAAEFTLEAWCEKEQGEKHPVYTVFVKIPKAAVQYYKMKTHRYNLYAEIPEDWNWGNNEKKVKQSSFENNIYLIPDSSDVEDAAVDSKHTQVIINDENARAIIKGNEYDAEKDQRTIPYRVLVNEECKDLLPGTNELDFKDTLTATYPYGVSVTLIPESFKIYIVDKDSVEYKKNANKHDVVDTSKIKRLKDITDSVSFRHEAGKQSGDDWVITAKLPDDKTILVQYDYHISGYTTGRERVNLKNTSEVAGVANDSNNDEWSDAIAVQKSGSGINIMRITLEKVDRSNENKALEGAVFKLYGYDGSKYVEIGEMVTNEEGKLIVDTGHIQKAGGNTELEFNYNTAYRLKEVRPPKGYKLSNQIIDFYVMDRDDPVTSYEDEEYIPNDFNGYLLGTDSFLYFDNVRANPKFKVTKVAATRSADVGDVIEYTIKAKNTSKDDAYDCTIIDIMGKGLEYVEDSLGGDNQGQKTTWTVDIMAGETVTIQFYARVKSSAGDDVTNTARVLYEGVDATTAVKDAAVVPVDESGDKSSDTGDRTMIYIAFAALLVAAAVAIAIARRRKASE